MQEHFEPSQNNASAPWVDLGEDTPFLFVSYCDNRPQIRGTESAFVGHRLHNFDDSRPRGLWGEWHWNGKELVASVDSVGFFSLFVYNKGGCVGISPSLLQLIAAGADPEPDPVALAVFHRVGFFVDCDTPFRHISVLPAGGRLFWRNGVCQIESGMQPPKHLSIKREQAVEAIIEIPRATIRRLLTAWQGPIALPLSGGRDSRHILLEMVHQGRRPDTCVTFHQGGRALDSEVQAACAVSQRSGVKHTILGQPRKRLRDSLRSLLMTQLCADEHAQMMPMHDFLSGSKFAAFDGIAGDILTNPDDSAAEFMERGRRGDWEGIARRMADGHSNVISRPGHRGGAGSVFSPDLDSEAVTRIADNMQRFADWPDPYQAFWFYNRTRREISFTATAVLGGAAMVCCPYLDPDFVELGLSLPWSVTSDQNLHNDSILRAFPTYADIPFADGFRSQPLRRLRFSRLTSLFDSIRIASLVEGNTLAGVRTMLAMSPLLPRPADIYRMHGDFIAAMSSSEAARLLAIDARLAENARRQERVVGHVHTSS